MATKAKTSGKAAAARKPAAKAVVKKAPVKKASVKKAPAKVAVKKVAAKAAPATKSVAKKAVAKKVAAVRKPVAKTVAKKAPVKKAVAKKAPAKKLVAAPVKAKSAIKRVAESLVNLVKPKSVKPVASKVSTTGKAPQPAGKPGKNIPRAPAAPIKIDAATRTGAASARNTMSNVAPAKKSKDRTSTPPVPNGDVSALPDRPALPIGYHPKPGEEYMSAEQLEYFRQKLLKWRADLVEESKQTIDNLREEVRDVGDDAERATRETENSLELRTRDRYRKLISKIDKALKRIDDGEYGYCEETGEEIGLDRLEARPIATLCFDAQERWEHRQKLMGD
ncbi:RNA polymerase-binding protein DksA [Xanthomonadaceae bacterium JHOS43]|nr:RNA polymerase-binding protein DksA [Xanthomonadaceae bacterium JHOS43]